MKPTTISLFSFLLVSLMLLAGCDSFGGRMHEGTISGQVVSTMDFTTPVPFAKVMIYLDDYCTQSYDPACWIPLDSTIADENGNFAIDHTFEDEYPQLRIKGYLDGYFIRTSGIISVGPTDTVQVLMIPKTYFKVYIEDEYPYDYSKYVGMWLSHTTFVPNDTVYQYPLDTTLLVEGNPRSSSGGVFPFNPLRYSLVYDRPNTIGSTNVLTNMECPPFDTCEVWIKF